jgi:hypothetical protein
MANEDCSKHFTERSNQWIWGIGRYSTTQQDWLVLLSRNASAYGIWNAIVDKELDDQSARHQAAAPRFSS